MATTAATVDTDGVVSQVALHHNNKSASSSLKHMLLDLVARL